jgi:hypothetical protein
MFGRKGLAAVALSAIFACGGIVRAADTASSTSVSLNPSNQPVLLQDTGSSVAPTAPGTPTPAAAPAVPTPPTPLMAGLEKIGVGKTLEDWNISIKGYVEGSWSFSANHPDAGNGGGAQSGGLIAGRVFDVEQESLILDQVDLNVTKSVDASKGKFDVGFTIDQVWGADAALFHSNGATIYAPTKIGLARDPKDQYDPEQVFVTLAVPVGNGLTITAGKFDTLLGNEVIQPTGNLFFSHSFLFGQVAFTQTGVLGQYNITDSLGVTGGFTRGWDQALDDNNGSLDLLGQVTYKTGNWNFLLTISSGDQEATGTGVDAWRTVLDPIATYQFSDNLKLTCEGMYGWEPQIDFGGVAQWYGACVYASYKLTDMFTLNGRGEWLDAPDGYLPSTGPTGAPNQLYEVTFGVAITPFPNGIGDAVSGNISSGLVIRPEVRVDYSDHGVFVGDNTHDQLTAAIEAYYAF